MEIEDREPESFRDRERQQKEMRRDRERVSRKSVLENHSAALDSLRK